MPTYYNVEKRTPYVMHLKRAEIEDLGEDFIEKEEMPRIRKTLINGEIVALLTHNVKHKLNEYHSRIKPGKNSIVIDDDELVEALKDLNINVSNLLGHGARSGNRLLRNKPTRRKKPRTYNSLLEWLQYICERCLLSDHDIDIELNEIRFKYDPDILKLYKKVITWEQIDKHIDEDLNRAKMRLIYENPTINELLN